MVVNYNAKLDLLECLRSLRAEGIEEIVVVDNASIDGSESAVRDADPRVDYHQSGSNLGYGTGCNHGTSLTDPSRPYLLCSNPDVRLEPGSLKSMVEALDGRTELGIVGPRIENPDGTLYPSVRTFPNVADAVGHAVFGMVWPKNPFTRRYRMLSWDHATAADVDWVSGSCFLVRRSAWEEVGGFDEAYFMYAEDVDLCWRLHRAGWSVAYEPGATVVHAQGVSTDRHPYRMIVEHHRALFRFASRSSRGWERALLPVMALGLVLRTPLAWLHRLFAGRRQVIKEPTVH